MPDSRPSLSVVMPTFNRRARLDHVLAPLLDDPDANEIVIVVDGCDDGSYELLLERASRHPRLRPLRIENRGENGARAAGVAAAAGDVVLLLDDDVRAGPGLAGGHADHHRDASDLVVLGYMPPAPATTVATRLYAREYEAMCATYERDADAVLRHLWAGNVSLRREQALRVLTGSEAPPLAYHADRALGLRCLAAGLRGVFDRSLRAAHLHERTLDGFVRDARNQGAASVVLHRLHGDELGPHPGPREFSRGLPAPLRTWLRVCRRPRAGAVSAWALRGTTRAAGRAPADGLEELSARLLRRVEQQRGALGQP